MSSALSESIAALISEGESKIGPSPALWAEYRELLGRRTKLKKGDPTQLAELCRSLGVDQGHLELHCLVLDEADRLRALSAELPERRAAVTAVAEELHRFTCQHFSAVQFEYMKREGTLGLSELDRKHPTFQRYFELQAANTLAVNAREEASQAGLVLHDLKIGFRELFDDPPGEREQASRHWERVKTMPTRLELLGYAANELQRSADETCSDCGRELTVAELLCNRCDGYHALLIFFSSPRKGDPPCHTRTQRMPC